MGKNKNKLTTRQKQLYSLLLHSEEPLSKEAICRELDSYVLERNKNNLNRRVNNCPELYEDVIAINKSDKVAKIVIVKRNTFRIGNKQEVIDYYHSLQRRANKILARCRRIKRKYHL